MSNFKYDRDLFKHYVRTQGWLPLCHERAQQFKKVQKSKKNPRQLRYFTFCGVKAVDVLMLDVAKIVKCSPNDQRFDSVVFFEKTNEDVAEIQKCIPGAVGFPCDFLQAVLFNDDDRDDPVDSIESLEPISDKEYIKDTIRQQTLRQIHRDYRRSFPFDILNFDLQDFFFKPNDPIPGNMVKALMKIFEWQRREGIDKRGKKFSINAFSLMFTTQIGPPNLGGDYLGRLENCLTANLDLNQNIIDSFTSRVGHADIKRLRQENFDLFFSMAMPKVLLSILKDQDWMVDDKQGISIYEFSRKSASGPYKILHLLMQVIRQDPPSDGHIPGTPKPQMEAMYQRVVRRLFEQNQTIVTNKLVKPVRSELKESFRLIDLRRKKYLAADYT